jgi:NADP-dependent 3-hydroxy acid dehydrogenase YdfG
VRPLIIIPKDISSARPHSTRQESDRIRVTVIYPGVVESDVERAA